MQVCRVLGDAPSEGLAERTVSCLAGGSLGSAIAAAMVPPWRRFAGALTEAPTTAAAAACVVAWMLPVAIGLAVLGFGRRPTVGDALRRGRSAPFASSRRRLAAGGSCAAAAVMAASLTLPGTAVGARIVLWLPAALLFCVAVGRPTTLDRDSGLVRVFRRRTPRDADPAPDARTVGRAEEARFGALEREPPAPRAQGDGESLIAMLERRSTPGGGESIAGRLAARFEPGRQTQSLHVSFCPPLQTTPKVEWSLEGEYEAEVRLVQRLPYGARFDVRLPEPAEDALVFTLRFTARAEE